MKTPFFKYVLIHLRIIILFSFLLNTLGPVPLAQAQEIRLPVPGVMVHLSPPEAPPLLKGVIVYPNNPFKFDFILDRGESGLSNDQLKEESKKLVKYFLSSITTPEQDLWVNLSPYEKSRIVPESFGQTDMGRDLLAEDYILKQITASLIYPEGEIGKQFWRRVYEEASKKFGTTNIPVNTFNKVWIVPDHAKVYEHGNTAFVVKASLKVMLEEDYLSLQKHNAALPLSARNDTHSIGTNIVREIVIPQLEKEVNEGKNFAPLRQVYYSLILAVWFKKRMKDSILGRKYMDQNKDEGIHYTTLPSLREAEGDAAIYKRTPNDTEAIYQRYLKAFKRGVYNYIKEEPNPVTQEMTPRKYFSGGAQMSAAMTTTDFAQTMDSAEVSSLSTSDFASVAVNLDSAPTGPPARPAGHANHAMIMIPPVAILNRFAIGRKFQEKNYFGMGQHQDFSVAFYERREPGFNVVPPDFNVPKAVFKVEIPWSQQYTPGAFNGLVDYIRQVIDPYINESRGSEGQFEEFLGGLQGQIDQMEVIAAEQLAPPSANLAMNTQLNDVQLRKLADETIILFRKIGSPEGGKLKDSDAAGVWWTTNPFYRGSFLNPDITFYMVQISRAELNRMLTSGEARNASLEKEFTNVRFKQTPQGVKLVPDSIKKLANDLPDHPDTFLKMFDPSKEEYKGWAYEVLKADQAMNGQLKDQVMAGKMSRWQFIRSVSMVIAAATTVGLPVRLQAGNGELPQDLNDQRRAAVDGIRRDYPFLFERPSASTDRKALIDIINRLAPLDRSFDAKDQPTQESYRILITGLLAQLAFLSSYQIQTIPAELYKNVQEQIITQASFVQDDSASDDLSFGIPLIKQLGKKIWAISAHEEMHNFEKYLGQNMPLGEMFADISGLFMLQSLMNEDAVQDVKKDMGYGQLLTETVTHLDQKMIDQLPHKADVFHLLGRQQLQNIENALGAGFNREALFNSAFEIHLELQTNKAPRAVRKEFEAEQKSDTHQKCSLVKATQYLVLKYLVKTNKIDSSKVASLLRNDLKNRDYLFTGENYDIHINLAPADVLKNFIDQAEKIGQKHPHATEKANSAMMGEVNRRTFLQMSTLATLWGILNPSVALASGFDNTLRDFLAENNIQVDIYGSADKWKEFKERAHVDPDALGYTSVRSGQTVLHIFLDPENMALSRSVFLHETIHVLHRLYKEKSLAKQFKEFEALKKVLQKHENSSLYRTFTAIETYLTYRYQYDNNAMFILIKNKTDGERQFQDLMENKERPNGPLEMDEVQRFIKLARDPVEAEKILFQNSLAPRIVSDEFWAFIGGYLSIRSSDRRDVVGTQKGGAVELHNLFMDFIDELGDHPDLMKQLMKHYKDLKIPEELLQDRAMIANHAQLPKNTGPGGIDLTAQRMNLEVEKDTGMVSQPMDLKAFENIEINGLYIKDIEIKPLKNLPELLGVSSSTPS